MRFYECTISGTPWERGRAHGEKLAEQIRQTQQFYADIFPISRSEVRRLAERYGAAICEWSPDYAEEIEGIAHGAGIKP